MRSAIKTLTFLFSSVFCLVQIVQADPRNEEILNQVIQNAKSECAAEVKTGVFNYVEIPNGISLEKDNYFSLGPEAIQYLKDPITGAETIIFRPIKTICAGHEYKTSTWCGAAGCTCDVIARGMWKGHIGSSLCE
jgi:hypothetical protein